jgi:hypothetical protein
MADVEEALKLYKLTRAKEQKEYEEYMTQMQNRYNLNDKEETDEELEPNNEETTTINFEEYEAVKYGKAKLKIEDIPIITEIDDEEEDMQDDNSRTQHNNIEELKPTQPKIINTKKFNIKKASAIVKEEEPEPAPQIKVSAALKEKVRLHREARAAKEAVAKEPTPVKKMQAPIATEITIKNKNSKNIEDMTRDELIDAVYEQKEAKEYNFKELEKLRLKVEKMELELKESAKYKLFYYKNNGTDVFETQKDIIKTFFHEFLLISFHFYHVLIINHVSH